MDGSDRRMAFEALVLSALWILIRRSFKDTGLHDAHEWRANALMHMDQYGNQREGSKEYRREKTYPPLVL